MKPIHHSKIQFTSDELKERRLGDWRGRLAEKITGTLTGDALEAAVGMTVHGAPTNKDREGKEALLGLNQADRMKVWKTIFPCLHREVELTWTKLPPAVIHQRDGGGSGSGTRFRFEPTPVESSKHFNEWIRKLVLISGPFPELDLAGLMAITESFCYGLRWPHDSDATAYAAVAVLNEGGKMAEPVWEVLRQTVDGTHHASLMGRQVRTALLCCEKPEAWELLDEALLGAGLDDGFRSELVTDRLGIHPGAWIHFLQTIRDHGLMRYRGIRESVEEHLGWSSYGEDLWRFQNRNEKDQLFETIVPLHEDPARRKSVLAGDSSVDAYFALFAMGTKDADSAVQTAGELIESGSDAAKIGAAFFLSEAGGPAANVHLRKGVGPENLLFSAIAHPLFSPDPEAFERISGLIERFDAAPKEDITLPPPWPVIRADRETYSCWLANSLPTGEEERIEPWLGRLGKRARDLIVTRLNRLEQSPAMRRILVRMMRDQDPGVAEHAVKAIWSKPLSRSELEFAEGVLELKSAKRREVIFRLLLKQPEPALRESVRRLLDSQKAAQRLGGLELIRRLSNDEKTAGDAQAIYDGWTRPAKQSKDELTQIEAIDAIFTDRVPEEASAPDWCLANAFGLVDPETLPVFDEPEPPDDVLLYSPITVTLLEQMERLYLDHRESEFEKRNWDGKRETVVLGEEGFPHLPYRKTYEEAKEEFPLISIWEDWWNSRPDELRDKDGFELERLGMLVPLMRHDYPAAALKLFFGIESFPGIRARSHHLSNILDWLKLGSRNPDWRSYWVTIAERTYFVEQELPKKVNSFGEHWVSKGNDAVFPWNEEKKNPEIPRELKTRMWRLQCLRDPDRKLGYHTLLSASDQEIATRDEFIWGLIGHPEFRIETMGPYHNPYVGEIGTLTNHAWSSRGTKRSREAIDECCQRMVDCEVRRGEAPTDASFLLRTVGRFTGASSLIKVLAALGSGKLQRVRDSRDGSREAIFTHLISVCHPGENDTAEAFAGLVKEAEISRDRLLEVSVFAPEWTDFVAESLEISGLKEAVGWIHAHTKTSEWNWSAKSRELWAGDLSRITPLTAEQLLDGAVDVDWFHRARTAVGDAVWRKLYEAAKFASSAAGHTRARLFSDALLDQVTRKELITRMRDKRHQDSARALGLLSLPKAKAKREKELQIRYRALSDFKAQARKAKPQRRASEMTAWQIGLDNLARNAGFDDPQRFQWTMEAAAVADLTSGDDSLSVDIDDLTARIEVTPWGKVEMAVERDGKPLKSLPAKLRKHPRIVRLRERQENFREQARRLRPELEEMMINRTALPAGEWQEFLKHPLVDPMLRRLVLATSRGPSGFPAPEGIVSTNGKPKPWPKSPLFLAHPHDFISSGNWPDWQKHCVRHEIVQPFKQIFREFYCPVPGEKDSVGRFAGHRIKTHQAFALFGGRGWVHHPDEGLHRVFHRAGIVAWLSFDEFFYHPREMEEATVAEIHFQKKEGGGWLDSAEVSPLIFSEVLRDVDLAVSVAHATGYDPEATESSVEMRAALVAAVCDLLDRGNVTIEDNKAFITGERARYRIHLGSGVVHQVARKMIYIQTDPAPERGRLFLPFADDDPGTAEILSKVLWLSEDEKIRDPGFLTQIEAS